MKREPLVCLVALGAVAALVSGCGSDKGSRQPPDGRGGEAGESSGGSPSGGGSGGGGASSGGSPSGATAGQSGAATGGALSGGMAGESGTSGESNTGGGESGMAGDGGMAGQSAAGEGGAAGAAGLPVIVHEEGFVVSDQVWPAAIHEMRNSFYVDRAVLEVEACSVIKMPPDGIITVADDGVLRLLGTEDCPITITSSSDTPQRGDWGRIRIGSTADVGPSQFDHVVIEYGGGLGDGMLCVWADALLDMRHTTVRESADYGVWLDENANLVGFSDNVLTANALGPIQLWANDVGQLGPGSYDGNDVDHISVEGGRVSAGQTWAAPGVPFRLTSTVTVRGSDDPVQLVLEPGVTLAFDEASGLIVDELGGLTAVGTASEPITFTSASSDPGAGDWDEIEIAAESNGAQNHLERAVIEYGGSSGLGLVRVERGASIQITDCTLTDSAAHAVSAQWGGELRGFAGNTLTGNALTPIALGADQVGRLGPGVYTPNEVEGIEVSQGNLVLGGATWPDLGVPLLLTDGLVVEGDTGSTHLTVAAGATLMMGPSATIEVRADAGLTLAGTEAAHVTLTSASATPTPGDWYQIEIEADSNGAQNLFTFTDIMYGGGEDLGQVWLEYGAALQLEDVTFSNGATSTCDVYLDGASTPTGTSTPSTCGP